MWQHIPGNDEARMLTAQYPSPRALREGIQMYGIGLIPAGLRTLPWNAEASIGMVVTSVHWALQDVRTLYTLLIAYAQDTWIWTAPDGTQTLTHTQP